ncbi:hypothetical protein EON64_01570 [archaeon]|nr:MAG: hypothetical protein EON64_01570 [archaeon]
MCLQIHELNGFLKQFEGSQSFHNFHRLNGKELRGEGKLKLLGSRDRVARRQQLRASGDSDDEEGDGLEGEEGEEYCEDNDIATAPVASAGHGAAGGSPAVLFFPYEDWVPRGRDISAKTQGNIYRCRASWFRGLAGQPMVKVEIAGQSFLLQ